MHVVKGLHWIIENDARFVPKRCKFRHECRQGNTTMLSFAQNLSHRSVGFPSECNLETGDPLRTSLLFQLHCEACNVKIGDLLRELCSECVSDQCLSYFCTLRGDAFGRCVSLSHFMLCDTLSPFNLGDRKSCV